MRHLRPEVPLASIGRNISPGDYPDLPLELGTRATGRSAQAGRGARRSQRPEVCEKCAQPSAVCAVAKEWLKPKRKSLTENTWNRDRDPLVKLAGPYLPSRPIGEIEAPEPPVALGIRARSMRISAGARRRAARGADASAQLGCGSDCSPPPSVLSKCDLTR